MELRGVTQPQFPGYGPHVLVRNTFLDFDEPSGLAACERRSRTVPPGAERGRRGDGAEAAEAFGAGYAIPPWPQFLQEAREPPVRVALVPPEAAYSEAPVLAALPPASQAAPQAVLGVGLPSGSSSLGQDAKPFAPGASASSSGDFAVAVPPQPQPQTLAWGRAADSGALQVRWTVDARKLRGNDKQAVSPPFNLQMGGLKVPFKMMICAKSTADCKGGACFKKARGRGIIQLKCEGDLVEPASMSFSVAVGFGAKMQEARGPVLHDFAKSAVRGLPEEQEEWDFTRAIDEDSLTFTVVLELAPGPRGAQGDCT